MILSRMGLGGIDTSRGPLVGGGPVSTTTTNKATGKKELTAAGRMVANMMAADSVRRGFYLSPASTSLLNKAAAEVKQQINVAPSNVRNTVLGPMAETKKPFTAAIGSVLKGFLPSAQGSNFATGSLKAATEALHPPSAPTAPSPEVVAAASAVAQQSAPLTAGGGGGGGGGAMDVPQEQPMEEVPTGWAALSPMMKGAVIGGSLLVAFLGYRMLRKH